MMGEAKGLGHRVQGARKKYTLKVPKIEKQR
jgi:hypothetical protein